MESGKVTLTAGKTTAARMRFIDVARAVAILSIIAGHLNSEAINSFVFTYNVPVFF